MPELPEVQTTVNGLNETVINKKIQSLWSDLPTKNHSRKNEIKDFSFWNSFKKKVVGATITLAQRRGKNILIELHNGFTILIHMKMTGHLMFGNYRRATKDDGRPKHSWTWWSEAPELQDPFNRFIHFVVTFTDETSLVFCDARKFGSISLVESNKTYLAKSLKSLGPDALEDELPWKEIKTRLMKQKSKAIKSVLLDQTLIAGIGNIYSDEILWLSNIHPLRTPSELSDIEWKSLTNSTKIALHKGLAFGGDSTSDYRNIYGKHGEFHHAHNAYQLTGKKCNKKNCKGTIQRRVVGGRSAHFCGIHQK